jgi:hypothetical protein
MKQKFLQGTQEMSSSGFSKEWNQAEAWWEITLWITRKCF